ncbi:hypothetical protein HDU93_003748 [Gonapodya sp. JEL0774]|nr:hypothetical protein HDU93_003748 [Gonapodya sp. JEL0774]
MASRRATAGLRSPSLRAALSQNSVGGLSEGAWRSALDRSRTLHLWGFGRWVNDSDKNDQKSGDDAVEILRREQAGNPLPPRRARTSSPRRPTSHSSTRFTDASDEALYNALSQQLVDSLDRQDTKAAWDAYSKMLDESLEKLDLSVWDHRKLLKVSFGPGKFYEAPE